MAGNTTTPAATSTPATYASLFPEQLADRCSPDALESNDGPVAYLHALYRQALEMEATSDSKERFTLKQRRPDIGELVLTEAGLKKEIPPLTLAINALTRQAQTHVGEKTSLAKTISEATQRAGLPFHYPLEQIKAVLRHKKLALFDLLQMSEYSFPNFCHRNLRTDNLRQVMRIATGFSPALQRLLLDDSASTGAEYLTSRFGVTGTSTQVLTQLRSVEFFCLKTGLKPEQVYDLLATSGVDDNASEGYTSVKRSSAYQPEGSPAVDGHLFGAAFINNGTAPALTLQDTMEGAGITLEIKGATAAHFGRIHKLIHLQHALGIPFADVDLLLMSALRAEGQTEHFHITTNTLRALGVFIYLKERYSVSAEQFAALIHEVSPYAVGERVPFLDRVLDGPGAGRLARIDDRLVLDNSEFDPYQDTDEQSNGSTTITRISSALGMDEHLTRKHLKQVASTLGLTKPKLSLTLLSSLYRLSRLPRLLRMSPSEGADLLALLTLGNPKLPAIVNGSGKIGNDPEQPDILDVLIALTNAAQWLQANALSATEVLAPLQMDEQTSEVMSAIEDARGNILGQNPPDIAASCVSEAQLSGVLEGDQALKQSGNKAQLTFSGLLADYVDESGLIKADLLAEPELKAAIKKKIVGKITGATPDEDNIAERLASELTNARIKQEDLTKDIFNRSFGKLLNNPALASSLALPLLKWIKKSPRDLLADLLSPQPEKDGIANSFALWRDLARHVLAVRLTGLSPAGLEALVEHPQWFAAQDGSHVNTENGDIDHLDAQTDVANVLNLDVLYQLTRYRTWVSICRDNKFEEHDALKYLSSVRSTTQTLAVESAASHLAQLVGWNKEDTLLAFPHLTLLKARPEAVSEKAVKSTPVQPKTVTTEEPAKKSGTLDLFIKRLSAEEVSSYSKDDGTLMISMILSMFHANGHKKYSPPVDGVNKKLKAFLNEYPGPLLVTAEQYKAANFPETWAADLKSIRESNQTPVIPEPLELRIIGTLPIEHPTPARDSTRAEDMSDLYDSEHLARVPTTLSDIDLVLRLQSLSAATGLACQSLLALVLLDGKTPYSEFHAASQLLIGTCSDERRQVIDAELQPLWRDGLTAYLMGNWVAANTHLKATITDVDDVSSYFLMDVLVSSEAKETTAVTHAIGSLQHYLFRLFSHLEPGYSKATLPSGAADYWQRYLSEYGAWKAWQAQINHPENLIYYANRPNKTAAFEELEVEVNQGKLDSELIETAVLNYLNKFERLSNLQIVSGYLDGRDPEKDTYYLIGKTNTSPPEYYLRSVDMGLRDDKQRLSPLAWTEWKKIDITPTGNIVQSTLTEDVDKKNEGDDSTKEKDSTVEVPVGAYSCDAVRPVIISGRPYVFWVERDTTGLPSSDPKNQMSTQYKRVSVHYIYLQSDGFWSTANELLRLDGTKNGEPASDPSKNGYLKDDKFKPGLIVFVNVEGERAEDPWLTAILYDRDKLKAAKNFTVDNQNYQYFVEMRDLLLIDRKTLSAEKTAKLAVTSFGTYEDIRSIQHLYDGQTKQFSVSKLENQDTGRDHHSVTVIPPDLYVGNGFTLEVNAAQGTPALVITAKLDGKVHDKTFEGKPVTVKLMVLEPGHDTKKELSTLRYALNTDINAQYSYRAPKSGRYKFSVLLEYLVSVDFGVSIYKAVDFEVHDIDRDELWDVLIARNTDQGQYLRLPSDERLASAKVSSSVRLNTLFGKNLVARASESVERVLSWNTQKLKEPTIDSATPHPPVDFHGANGLYFRELFLHLPALIATRLTEQQQFEEAETWYLRYLFNPYRALPEDDGRPAYWSTRPLAEAGSLNSELNKSVDPIARAFILSRYYRQAVFLNVVENWQKQGDHYYRQLTLSTLNHAWLCYQQALKLIGPLPQHAAVSRWSAVDLASVTESSFRIPINKRVIEARNILESRLYNLRHGLTLDGKALPNLGWGDEGSDPFASAKGGLSIIPSSYNSDRASIPAYRFRQLLPVARAAAQQLLDMGRHYMKLMEDESNTSLSVLLKTQEIRISDFTLQLCKEKIDSVTAKKRELELSREAAEFRRDHWANLLEIGRSPREEAATALIWTAGVLKYAAIPTEIIAGGIDGIVPTILGMAVGGTRPAELTRTAAKGMSMSSTALSMFADQLQAESGYERRATGWIFDMRQAEWDIRLIDQQIKETNIELNASTISLEQARQERKNLDEAYVAMTTGFTIIPIYNWLVARQELLYGAAYDAVLSLCLSLESAWRFEIGDYKRKAFIKTSAWSDSYKGMLAGESLLVDLQHMENAYLLANERRLTIKKSFSLKKLQSTEWEANIKELAKGTALSFEFKTGDFDKHYPGHYLRQLKHVSVSFVVKAGKSLDELAAILTQTANTTLIEPDNEGIEYLKTGSEQIPSSIKRNLRAQQQIALSSQVQEDGLGYSPGEWVYELMFHDGRYLPFEGTGAISQWQLQIPDIDIAKSLKDAVEDIQINLVYTALPGNRTPGG